MLNGSTPAPKPSPPKALLELYSSPPHLSALNLTQDRMSRGVSHRPAVKDAIYRSIREGKCGQGRDLALFSKEPRMEASAVLCKSMEWLKALKANGTAKGSKDRKPKFTVPGWFLWILAGSRHRKQGKGHPKWWWWLLFSPFSFIFSWFFCNVH